MSTTIETTSNPIKEEIEDLLGEYSTSTQEIALAIIEAKSDFKNVEGVTGDMGYFQFSPTTWEDVCSGDPYNMKDNILCGVQEVNKNQLWRWSDSRNDRENYQGWFSKLSSTTQQFVLKQDILCSCVLFARRYADFPPIHSPADLQPNTFPEIGVAVLLDYSIGGSHIAIVTGWADGGFKIMEANYFRCRSSERVIKWSDTHIRGFYK
ncbi:MAG: hypothetical protein K9M15_02775 [Candidatus Marinimicrobia bacterium]|nr:hypothetical protein [Candidatus Neomarinimicrobiota bacterium]